jgi:hypothetical protein
MDKKITDLTAQQICDLTGNEMDEEHQNVFTSVDNLRKRCLTILNDEFIDYFHDEGQLHPREILEICRGDKGQRDQRYPNDPLKKSLINALIERSLSNSKSIDEWIAWNTDAPNEEVA